MPQVGIYVKNSLKITIYFNYGQTIAALPFMALKTLNNPFCWTFLYYKSVP